MLLNIDAHCLNDETVARFSAMGVEIEDKQKGLWQILFRGPENVLREILKTDWDLSQEEIESTIAGASDTEVDVRKATPDLIEKAVKEPSLDACVLMIQDAIGATTGDNASIFFNDAQINGWPEMDLIARRELMMVYVAHERLMNYPQGFEFQVQKN